MKIVYQGEKGAYSHLACSELFPDVDTVGCPTFEDAFELTKENPEYKLIIPIENSLAGTPATVMFEETSLDTTEFAPILALSPIFIEPKI